MMKDGRGMNEGERRGYGWIEGGKEKKKRERKREREEKGRKKGGRTEGKETERTIKVGQSKGPTYHCLFGKYDKNK